MEILTAAETSMDQLLAAYSAGRIGRRELLAVADALDTLKLLGARVVIPAARRRALRARSARAEATVC